MHIYTYHIKRNGLNTMVLFSTYQAVRREDKVILAAHAEKEAQSDAEMTSTLSCC